MESKQRYTITSALPYTNGPLHIGHLAGAYIPADIFARFKRLTDNDVAYICGSDEHGVAISIKAKSEGKTIKEVIDKYLTDSDIAVFKHPQRDCIYIEGEFVKQIKFDHPNLLEDQLEFYKDMCYPKNNGLYELPVRVQRNTKLTQQMGWMWWEQICMFSSRDQISFPFVCHQLGIKPTILPGVANTIQGNEIMPQLTISNHSRTL